MPEWIVDPGGCRRQARQVSGRRRARRLAPARGRGARARQGVPQRSRGDARPMPPRGSPPATPCALWADRPGSARSARTPIGDARDLPIVYEDDALIVLEQAGRACSPCRCRCSGASMRRRCSRTSRPTCANARRRPFVVHRIDRDTSGLVLFAKSEAAQDALKAAVQPARAGARLSRRRLRPAVAARGHLAGSSRLGSEGADSEGDAPARSAREGSDQPLPRRRTARRGVARSKCASSPANEIRSASRRGCADTRWSVSSAISTGRTRCERLHFPARRYTLTGWRSAIPTTIASCDSRRRCRRTSPRFDRAPADALPDNVIRMRRFATREQRPRALICTSDHAGTSHCGMIAALGCGITLRIRNLHRTAWNCRVTTGPMPLRRHRSQVQVQVLATSLMIHELSIERASIVDYLKTIAPDKQVIALVHAHRSRRHRDARAPRALSPLSL